MSALAHPLIPSPVTLGVPVAAQPIFINYWDTGCKYAPACLTCPFSMCYHDDAETFSEELGHRFEGRLADPTSSIAEMESCLLGV